MHDIKYNYMLSLQYNGEIFINDRLFTRNTQFNDNPAGFDLWTKKYKKSRDTASFRTNVYLTVNDSPTTDDR